MALVSIVILSACATHRGYAPSIQSSPRAGLTLQPPLLVAFLDGRSDVGSSADGSAATRLAANLRSIYGTAVQDTNYFASTPDGRVELKIRIRTLGADFGSRVVTSTDVQQAYDHTGASGSSNWGFLVADIEQRHSTLASSISAEGWWIGTAWLDISLIDRRPNGGRLDLPLIAEAKKANTLGYSSATKATDEAWRKVSEDLLFVIDEVAARLR